MSEVFNLYLGKDKNLILSATMSDISAPGRRRVIYFHIDRKPIMSSPVYLSRYVQKKAEIFEQMIHAIPSASVLLDEDGVVIACNDSFSDFIAQFSPLYRRIFAGAFLPDILPLNQEKFRALLGRVQDAEETGREAVLEIRRNFIPKELPVQWRVVASFIRASYPAPPMILLIGKSPSESDAGVPFHEGVQDSERERSIRDFYSQLSRLFHTGRSFRSIVGEIFGRVERQFNCLCSLKLFNADLFPVIDDNFSNEIGAAANDNIMLLHDMDNEAKARCAAHCTMHNRLHELTDEEDDCPGINKYKRAGYSSVFSFPVRIGDQNSGCIVIAMKPNPLLDREIISMGEFLARNTNGILEKNYHFFARLQAEKKQAEIQHIAEKVSRLASIGVMVSAITHDINNSLGTIKFSVDNALYAYRHNNAVIPEFIVNKLLKIEESMQNIEEHLKHVRSFWIEPDQLKNKKVNLGESIRQVISVLAKDMENNGIDVIINTSSEPLFIYGNSVQIEQIVSNLVVNAAQALRVTAAGGRKIMISAFRRNDRIILQVHDTGPGLSAEVLKKISESIIAIKDSNRSRGLGLAIVKFFVEGHGGTITAENSGEGGAQITISFPVIENKELPDENPAC